MDIANRVVRLVVVGVTLKGKMFHFHLYFVENKVTFYSAYIKAIRSVSGAVVVVVPDRNGIKILGGGGAGYKNEGTAGLAAAGR